MDEELIDIIWARAIEDVPFIDISTYQVQRKIIRYAYEAGWADAMNRVESDIQDPEDTNA